MLFGQFMSFILLLIGWSILAIIAKLLKLDRRGIVIYPLVFIVKSDWFKRVIQREANRRGEFLEKYATVSSRIFIVVIIIAVLYFITNLYFLARSELVVPAGIPVGTALVPIIPFLTVNGKLLLYLIIGSAIAIIPHELAHGVVAVKKGIGIESAGFFLIFGAVLGGFVEIPEQFYADILKEKEESTVKKNNIELIRVFKKVISAGILINIVFFAMLYGVALNYPYLMSPFFKSDGVKIIYVERNSPAYNSGLVKGMIIREINGTIIRDIDDFLEALGNASPGDTLIIRTDNGSLMIKLGRNPQDENKPYLGITITNYYRSNIPFIPDEMYEELFYFIYITMLLQFIIILLNALPIFVSDGAKFLFFFLRERIRNRVYADKLYLFVNWLCLIIILLNFIFPLIS